MWKSWDIDEWGKRLLDHFFLRSIGNSVPVEALLVTAEEIAAATGDSEAKPDDVKARFIDAVLSGVGDATIMDHAFEMAWSPKAPDVTPPIMAHLMVACLAASESTEEFGDEGSFIRRLEIIARGRFGKLEHMPHHWRRFAEWLEAGSNPVRYRRLVLPDPGHLARIGYTVNLAFPDRRDQAFLSALLAENKLDQDDPPLAKVIALVAEHRASFRRRFLEAFDDFRRLADIGGTPLHRHRFWVAVIAGARRGRAGAIGANKELKRQLLAWMADDVATFCVGSAQPWTVEGYKTLPLPVAFGDYRHAIVPAAEMELSGSAINAGVAAALKGRLFVGSLRACVGGGVVPFGLSGEGQLECLIGDDLESAALALVRMDLMDAVLQKFGGRIIGGSIEGWSTIAGCQLRRLPATELEAGPLARTWLLQATVPRPSLRLAGGIATEDGWLGYARVLPRVRFGTDAELFIDGGSGNRPLTRVNGHWELPRENLSGPHMLSASAGGEILDMRMIRFQATPAEENYKPPADPGAWWVEGPKGTARLPDVAGIEFGTSPADVSRWTEVRAYLGANVGEFKRDATGAVWTALRRSGHTVVARCDPTVQPIPPSSQGTDKGANRRWRKILSAHPAPDDPGLELARAGLWKLVNGPLPKAGYPPAPCLVDYEPVIAKPAPELREFIPIIAARGCAVAGIPRRDVHELARLILGIDEPEISRLLRAWCDAGLIDMALFARWCSTKIFPRRPTFLGYRDGTSHVAMLTGLVLPLTRETVRDAAKTRDVTTWDKGAFSRFVPPALCLRASSVALLEEIAAATRIPLRWPKLDLGELAKIASLETDKHVPSGYSVEQPREQWSASTIPTPHVTVTMRMRSDAPAIWIASANGGTAWSYSANTIRQAACTLARAEALTRRGANELLAVRAFLPTPIARVVALVAQAMPGHDGTAYCYSFNTERFRSETEEAFAGSIPPLTPSN